MQRTMRTGHSVGGRFNSYESLTCQAVVKTESPGRTAIETVRDKYSAGDWTNHPSIAGQLQAIRSTGKEVTTSRTNTVLI